MDGPEDALQRYEREHGFPYGFTARQWADYNQSDEELLPWEFEDDDEWDEEDGWPPDDDDDDDDDEMPPDTCVHGEFGPICEICGVLDD